MSGCLKQKKVKKQKKIKKRLLPGLCPYGEAAGGV
jgi:hypothetical protein